MSLTPRVSTSSKTSSQNLAPSVLSIHNPSTSRVPSAGARVARPV